ncbi:RNase H family protein [Phascolarctobacterium succinatutens]|uniref:RNase H family protein n=1 Tax=Phascolarctobacterium succinatutens TaxID=626940 RepID=UPI0026EDE4F8|nr:RNase H family protein [Phascolarctobacterium succinatutens]
MSNVDYPIDDFSAIAYVDASYSDTGRFGSIGIVMLTRSEVIQYSEIPENLEDCALTSTNHELLAAAKAIQMAKERHIKNLIIKHDNNSIAEVAKSHSVTKTSMEEWYKQLVMKHREKMSITFKKVKGHSKEYFNELADTLANKALKAERVKRANTPLFFSLGDKFQEALAKVKICG